MPKLPSWRGEGATVKALSNTFSSLRVRNYRLFFFGQLTSMSGSWMQTVALGWLVLRLSGNGVAVGVNFALQFLPMLLFGMWGGVLADRFDKRRVLMMTQSTLMALAFVFFAITVTGVAELWMVYALTFALGCVQAIDMPTRQAFVTEMVSNDGVANAVSLNSAVFNAARIFGPAFAGLLIETVGLPWAFFVNGFSYIAVIGAYALIRPGELHRGEPAPREKGQIRAGFRYVWRRPELRYTLMLVTVVSGLGLNFTVVLPLMVRFVFAEGADTLGLLTSVMAVGSLSGALFSAARNRPTRRLLIGAAAAFGALELVAAAAPNLAFMAAVLLPVGIASILFIATANSTLQLNSSQAMRGRVMALYALVFLGSAPLGGPLVGWISEAFGPRMGLVLGGVASLSAAAVAVAAIRREQIGAAYRSLSPGHGSHSSAVLPEGHPEEAPAGRHDARRPRGHKVPAQSRPRSRVDR